MTATPKRSSKPSRLSGYTGEPHALYENREPHGGRSHPKPKPQIVSRRVQVLATDHPSTDRWITLTTTHQNGIYLYRVGVVDGYNRHAAPSRDFPTLRRARNAANRLHNELTEEEA